MSEFYENANKFKKIGYSGISPFEFVYVGKEQIHKCVQYEVSMTV